MQQPFWMLTPMDAHSIPELWPAGRREADAELPAALTQQLGSQPEIKALDGKEWFCDQLLKSGRVCLFGGGHVAQALVPALAAVDFRCVVLEDREDFCRPELFSGVEETRLIRNDDPAAYEDITAEDYIAVMTRGHKDDLTVQAQALKTQAKYIGVIGSRKKTETINARLLERGFTQKDLARATTPIGLDIRAETPAEIAISIAAQLILHRANR